MDREPPRAVNADGSVRRRRVLICGSRHWTRAQPIKAFVTALPIDAVVITGGATGVDSLADMYAKERGMSTVVVAISRALWRRLGTQAGPVRNRLMLDLEPDAVVYFHTDDPLLRGSGTYDCVTEAEARGITTYRGPG